MPGWGDRIPKKGLSQISLMRQQLDKLEQELNRAFLERDRNQNLLDRYEKLYGPLDPPNLNGC